MAKSTKAHIKSSVTWEKNNKAKHRYYHYKSCTRTFIRTLATQTDIKKVIRLARHYEK